MSQIKGYRAAASQLKSLAVGGWGVGGPSQKIMPLCGSLLQDETFQDGAECGKK